MENIKLILTDPVLSPVPLDRPDKAGETSDSKKVQVARDFESVFLTKLLDEMKNTIGQWDDEEDAASQQVQGLFWMYLARDIADKGGFGLWKDIYQFLKDTDRLKATAESLDENI